MAEIGLVDSDSADELVSAVERAFAVKLPAKELASCNTVGALFDILKREVVLVERGAPVCLSAKAFWRLQTTLQQDLPGRDIRPATRLSDLMPVMRKRRWWARLSRKSGLDLPLYLPKPPADLPESKGWTYFLATRSALMFAGVLLQSKIAAVGVVVCGVWLVLPRRWPWPPRSVVETVGMGSGATLGDLAAAAAWLNAGALAAPYGKMRTRDAWAALQGTIRHYSGYCGPIDKRTAFTCT